jgi:hypothetical protein
MHLRTFLHGALCNILEFALVGLCDLFATVNLVTMEKVKWIKQLKCAAYKYFPRAASVSLDKFISRHYLGIKSTILWLLAQYKPLS